MTTREKIKNKRAKCDVIGIGSPLLDIIVNVDDEVLHNFGFKKGSMNLISKDESLNIEKKVANLVSGYIPGGSSANTISGVNVLGTKAGIMGVIGGDEYGKIYHRHTENEGVFSYLCFDNDYKTGHSFIFVTPDKERTFATYLGAAVNIRKDHIRRDEIINAKVFHIEAYQLEHPQIREAILSSIKIAKDAKTKISLDLSDAGLIRRNKKLLKDLVEDQIDIVFANEDEAKEFTGKDREKALHEISNNCDLTVVKLGEKGSLIKEGEKVHRVQPCRVEVENTNGAGDMYAAGILHGFVNNFDMEKAGKIASHVASLVVASPGARIHNRFLDSVEVL